MEPKVFRITGMIRKPNLKTHFTKEIRALKPEDAIEKIFTDMGSKHRVKRHQIKILEIKEIGPEEITDPVIKKLVEE